MELNKIVEWISQGKEVRFYQSKEWRAVRLSVLKRDNYECQPCKRKGVVTTCYPMPTLYPSANSKKKNEINEEKNILQVHHIKELKDFPELALIESNLETVCIKCHNEIHDRLVGFQTKKEDKWNDERW